MVDKKTIELFIVKSWDIDEIIYLYELGGWWKPEYDRSKIPELIRNSFAFCVVVDTKSRKAIGMGRVLSDGVSDAYIQDLIIHPQFRKRGIGAQLVQYLIKHCLEHSISWIGLIAEPGTESFYVPLGFTSMKNYTPLLYQKPD